MDHWDAHTETYLLNGTEYKEKVAMSYLQAIVGFSATEAEDFLASLRAEAQASEAA